jgi:hypothetical protein
MKCRRILAVAAVIVGQFFSAGFASANSIEVFGFTSADTANQQPAANKDDAAIRECVPECYCPVWRVEAGAIFLHRSKAHPSPILSSYSDPSLELINTSDFDLGFSSGTKVSIARNTRIGELEVLYFGIDGWAARQSIERVGDLYIVPNWGMGSDAFDSASARYRSRLYNTEVNLKNPLIGDIKWLAGFRWVELHESVYAEIDGTQSGGEWGDLYYGGVNHMYGIQLGLEGTVCKPTDRLKIDGMLKAGMYHNVVAGVIGGSIFEEASTGSVTRSSFLGELGLFASYQLTDHFSVRGGYQALWLQGVLIAPEPITGVDGSSAFYHGPSAGIEAVW